MVKLIGKIGAINYVKNLNYQYWNVDRFSRAIQSKITRLRLGTAKLGEYQFKIKQRDSPLCHECDIPDTVNHFLLECCKFETQREKLFDKIKDIFNLNDISEITMNHILGGEPMSNSNRILQENALVLFIVKSGKNI